jgi:hypothetical protein
MIDPWPDEKIERLRTLHAAGRSYGEIARALGCTRSAAIGKASRLGLAKRARIKPVAEIIRHPRKRVLHPRIHIVGNQVKKPRPELDLRSDLDHEIARNPIALFDLKAHHCRWPVSGEGASTLFCGADKTDGSSYCQFHFEKSCRSAVHIDRAEQELRVRRAIRERVRRAA